MFQIAPLGLTGICLRHTKLKGRPYDYKSYQMLPNDACQRGIGLNLHKISFVTLFSSGGCLGHTICTGAAVLVGMIVAKFISARVITFIGALVFIGFAIASIFIDPNANGIDIQVKELIYKCYK